MIPLGLSSSDELAFVAALNSTHSIHITVQLLDLNHNRIANLSPYLLDGQVDVDADAEVSRSAKISLFDPTRSLAIDSRSPSAGALHLDRMIRLVYSVKVPDLGWVDCPVFCGPVTKVDRSNDVIDIEALGKEALAMNPIWRPITLRKGMNKVDAIRTIMEQRAGETRFTFPNLSGRLPKDVSLGRSSVAWSEAQRLARSLDRQLFYDGRGYLRLRREPTTHGFTFADGTGGNIETPVQISYDSSRIRNAVHVTAGNPPGKTKPISVFVTALPSHQLSPRRLGRTLNDGTVIPRHLVETINEPSIRNEPEARRLAETRLKRLLLQHIEVQFDTFPIPHLEPGDRVRVKTRDFSTDFRLRQFSLPLGPEGSMSVGYRKRVSVRKRRSRSR